MGHKGESGDREGGEKVSLEQLAGEVAEALGGFTVLDRGLSLEGKRRADLVGIDADRRLTLVLVRDAEATGSKPVDALTVAVLDALAWARRHREVVARHFDAAALDPAAPPRVIVVADGLPGAFLERMDVLSPDPVLALERQRLASATSESTFLIPARTSGEPAGPPGPADFLDGLDEVLARRATVLLRRLARLDDELSCGSTRGGLRWTLRGVEVCELADDPAGLVGRVAGRDEPMVLAGDESVDGFLDAALGRYLELTQDPLPSASPAGGPTAPE